MEHIKSFCFVLLMPLIRFSPLYCSSICPIFARRVIRRMALISLRMRLLILARLVVSVCAVARRWCIKFSRLC